MYLIASLLVPLALLVEQKRGLTIFVVSAFIMAVTLVAFMIFDHVVLIDMLGFYLLDPVRFIAEVYLVLVLFAGLGLAYLPLWLSREGRAQVGMLVGGLAMVLALVWMGRPFLDLVRSHRDGNQFLAQARQSFPLDETWQALQSGEGRILFSSYYLHLGEVPTALKSATPFFTGRNIIGGTFSHWSPVARVLWTGSTDAQLLPGQVELTDDISLAGRAWIDWTDGEMYKLCQQLNVTTVATTWDDINARTFLDAAPHFQSFYSNDLFVLYRVLDPEPGLIAADGATTAVIHAGPTALDLHVTGATTNASLQIGITDYPLWRVQAGDQKIPHHADGLGLMSVPIPPGSYDLTLRYLPGPAEWVGTLLSLAATVVWLSLGVYSLLPGARRLSTEA